MKRALSARRLFFVDGGSINWTRLDYWYVTGTLFKNIDRT